MQKMWYYWLPASPCKEKLAGNSASPLPLQPPEVLFSRHNKCQWKGLRISSLRSRSYCWLLDVLRSPWGMFGIPFAVAKIWLSVGRLFDYRESSWRSWQNDLDVYSTQSPWSRIAEEMQWIFLCNSSRRKRRSLQSKSIMKNVQYTD